MTVRLIEFQHCCQVANICLVFVCVCVCLDAHSINCLLVFSSLFWRDCISGCNLVFNGLFINSGKKTSLITFLIKFKKKHTHTFIQTDRNRQCSATRGAFHIYSNPLINGIVYLLCSTVANVNSIQSAISLLFFFFLSVSPVNIGSPLDKWEELNLNCERNGNRKWKLERRRSSKNSSNEFLWQVLW